MDWYTIQAGDDAEGRISIRKSAAGAYRRVQRLARLGVKTIIIKTAEGKIVQVDELAALVANQRGRPVKWRPPKRRLRNGRNYAAGA